MNRRATGLALAALLTLGACQHEGGGELTLFGQPASGPVRAEKQMIAAGEEPESLDKEFLRLWIRGRCDPYNDPIPKIPTDTLIEFSGKYVKLYEQVTGQTFAKPDQSMPIRDRIRASLEQTFPEYFKS